MYNFDTCTSLHGFAVTDIVADLVMQVRGRATVPGRRVASRKTGLFVGE